MSEIWIATEGEDQFWQHPTIKDLAVYPRLRVQTGTPGRNRWAHAFKELANDPQWTTYVYLLHSPDGQLIYLGKALTPHYRIPQHQRKQWWPEVSTAVILAVPPRETFAAADMALREVEAIALTYLPTTGNVAKPSKINQERITSGTH